MRGQELGLQGGLGILKAYCGLGFRVAQGLGKQFGCATEFGKQSGSRETLYNDSSLGARGVLPWSPAANSAVKIAASMLGSQGVFGDDPNADYQCNKDNNNQ